MKQKLFDKLNSAFFSADSGLVLKVYRGILCFYLLLFHSSPSTSGYSEFGGLYQPVGIFKYLGPLEDIDSLVWMTWVFRISLVLAAFGIFGSGSLLAALLTGAYVLAYNYNFGSVGHGTTLIYFCLCLLLLVPRQDKTRWALQFLKCFIAGSYFIAGIQKLRFSGFEWAWSENLAMIIFQNKATPVGEFLLNLPAVGLRFVAVGILAVELLSPFALVNKRTGKVFFWLWAAMHLGIQLALGNHKSFLSQIPCALVFQEDFLLFAGKRAHLAWGRLKELIHIQKLKVP